MECAKLCIVLTADLSAVCTLCTNLGHPTVKFNRFPGLARRRPLLIKVAPSTMERILASPMATNYIYIFHLDQKESRNFTLRAQVVQNALRSMCILPDQRLLRNLPIEKAACDVNAQSHGRVKSKSLNA